MTCFQHHAPIRRDQAIKPSLKSPCGPSHERRATRSTPITNNFKRSRSLSLFHQTIPDNAPSLFVSSVETSATGAILSNAEPAVTFAPIMPDTATLISFAIISVLCAVVTWVWANQVVPVSRKKLALSKRDGPVKEYLDELKASAPGSDDSYDTTSPTIPDSITSQGDLNETREEANVSKERAFERWLFSDWLSDDKRKKEAAIPILKKAKWNSGDNPVLVASGLILLGVVIASVTERVSGSPFG